MHHPTLIGCLASLALLVGAPASAQEAEPADSAEPSDPAADTADASANAEPSAEEEAQPWLDAEPVDLERLENLHKSVRSMDMRGDEPALVADGTTFEDDLVTARFEEGYFFPVFAGRTEAEWEERDAEAKEPPEEEVKKARLPRSVVGYIFVGSGSMSVAFPYKNYAMDFANHMVMNRGRPKEDFRAIAHEGAPFETTFSRAMVISADPSLESFLDALPQVALDDGKASDLGQSDPVVVPEENAFNTARKTAEKMFEDRLDVVQRAGVSASDWVASDLLALAEQDARPEDVRLLADFVTADRYGHVVERKGGDNEEDRRIALVRDHTGRWDAKLTHEVFAFGESSSGVGGRTLSVKYQPPWKADDPLSPPLPPVHPEPLTADVTMIGDLTNDGFYLEGNVRYELSFKAVGGPMRTVQLRLGRFEEVNKTWEVKAFELEDGSPCTWLDPESDDFKKMSGELTCILPKPLREGGEATLVIEAAGTFPYANVMQGESTAQQGSLGLSTGLQMQVPDLAPWFGGGYVVTQRIGLPADTELKAAISGETIGEWEEGGKRWVEAKTAASALYPGFAVGSWNTVQVPAFDSGDPNVVLPSMRVHLFDKDLTIIAGFPPEMRKILAVYQRYMPPFPWPEMELFQAPDMFYGYVWIAPHGMVNLQQTRVFNEVGSGESAFRDGTPHMEEGVLAHELAHQYWGHTLRASHISEGFVNETMSETFSCLYVGAAFGPDAFTQRMDKYRDVWENRLPKGTWASEYRAYESPYQPLIVYNYGPYVMNAMLRPRIGDEAFFRALDSFGREHYRDYISAEQFMAQIQAQTDEDLSDFFEFWIYGGYVPDEVLLTYEVQGRKIVGEITSNIPFGTFDVPIRLTDKAGEQTVMWVDVVDGKGSFETDKLGAVSKVQIELDPDGQILARTRKVKKG